MPSNADPIHQHPPVPSHLQALDNISAFPSVSNFLQWGLIQVRPASAALLAHLVGPLGLPAWWPLGSPANQSARAEWEQSASCSLAGSPHLHHSDMLCCACWVLHMLGDHEWPAHSLCLCDLAPRHHLHCS